MADNDLRTEMAQMDQTLFGDAPQEAAPAPQPAPAIEVQPAAQPEEPSLGDLFAAAGLEAPGAVQPAAQEPVPQAEVPAVQEPELAGGQEPTQQDIMQAYVQQQSQLNEQLAAQQQALLAQQQQPVPQHQPNMNDPRELAEMMTTVGLDPTSAEAVFMFRSEMTNRQNQAYYQDQMAQMQNHINMMTSQHQQAQSAAVVAPQVEATLKAYGEIPGEVVESIKAQAATILSENLGNATEAQAIQWAVEPYLPLLRMVKQQVQQQPQPAIAPAAARPNVNASALMAAALSGGSSGHGPTPEDIDITQLEKALFRSN